MVLRIDGIKGCNLVEKKNGEGADIFILIFFFFGGGELKGSREGEGG
jgi:hypothetical protein